MKKNAKLISPENREKMRSGELNTKMKIKKPDEELYKSESQKDYEFEKSIQNFDNEETIMRLEEALRILEVFYGWIHDVKAILRK